MEKGSSEKHGRACALWEMETGGHRRFNRENAALAVSRTRSGCGLEGTINRGDVSQTPPFPAEGSEAVAKYHQDLEPEHWSRDRQTHGHTDLIAVLFSLPMAGRFSGSFISPCGFGWPISRNPPLPTTLVGSCVAFVRTAQAIAATMTGRPIGVWRAAKNLHRRPSRGYQPSPPGRPFRICRNDLTMRCGTWTRVQRTFPGDQNFVIGSAFCPGSLGGFKVHRRNTARVGTAE